MADWLFFGLGVCGGVIFSIFLLLKIHSSLDEHNEVRAKKETKD